MISAGKKQKERDKMARTLTLIAGIALVAVGAIALIWYLLASTYWTDYGIVEFGNPSHLHTVRAIVVPNIFMAIGLMVAGVLLIIEGSRSEL